ncbi:hypothetical protein, partial [uncultured Acinetobacter sp.]|uniref:hypothetical protein n=1 Tax=uncultured Acinetobacter sp. TaxID=165433 RepID=UPI00258F6B21
QVISIFLKLNLQTHNLTTQAKLLFFNKFISASPPMDVHSTPSPFLYNPFRLSFFSSEQFLFFFAFFMPFLKFFCFNSSYKETVK